MMASRGIFSALRWKESKFLEVGGSGDEYYADKRLIL